MTLAAVSEQPAACSLHITTVWSATRFTLRLTPPPVPCCCTPPPRLQCTAQVYLTAALQSTSSDSTSQHPLLRTPLMDAAEVELVLRGFNNTDLAYDRQAFVHGQFMARAQEAPDAACVVFEDYVFTYAEVGAGCQHTAAVCACAHARSHTLKFPEPAIRAAETAGRNDLPQSTLPQPLCCRVLPLPTLQPLPPARLCCWQIDAASNRIANYLVECAGVTPGSIVAVLVLRSPLMVATLLGVLKAGAGYLPLDHHHPEGRIAFMLEDAAVKVSKACRRACSRPWG